MSPDEFADIVEWIEDHWPGTTTWRTAEKVFDDFCLYDTPIVQKAAQELFAAGRQSAPSPSMLIAEVKKVAANSPNVSYLTDPGPHNHSLGELPPTMRFGGMYATHKGPGLVSCSDIDCSEERPCHCDPCREDPLYAQKVTEIPPAELEENRKLIHARRAAAAREGRRRGK